MKSAAAKIGLIALAIFVAGASACRGFSPDRAGRAVFRLSATQEPESLDPALYTSLVSSQVLGNIFEGLLHLDPQTLAPLPGAAESYTVSKDGLTWRFTLRPGLRFSDGSPVLASDFVYAFRRLLDPAVASEYAFLLYAVHNAKAFFEGKIKDPRDLGLSAPDPRTVVIRLERPRPALPLILTDPHLVPLREAVVRLGPSWTKPGRLVSNGPFFLTEWKPYDCMVLRPNPHYRDFSAIRLQAVEIYPLDNLQTMVNYYLAGKLDWVTGLPLEALDQLSKRPDYRQFPYLGVYAYIINTRRPYLADVRVRRALNCAIDKERIAKFVVRTGKLPAWSWVPSFMPNYTPPTEGKFDPAAAREWLAQAGYGLKGRFPKISIHFNTLETNRKIAEVVQAMLAENLGLEVVLENQEWKVYVQNQRAGQYDLSRQSFEADYPDVSNYLEVYSQGNPYNKTGWSNPAFDRLLRQADFLNGPARFRLLARAEAVMLRDLPMIPLYFFSRTSLLSPRVKGFQDNILDMHDFRELWIEEGRG